MKVISATDNSDGVEPSTRRFGTPSRLANSKPYSKPSLSAKDAFKMAVGGASYDLDSRSPSVAREDQENFVDVTQANLAFDFSGDASSLLQEPTYDGDLTVNDLNLPPFKDEQRSKDLLSDAPANNVVDGPQLMAEDEEDSKDFNYDDYDDSVLQSSKDEPGMPSRAEFARITDAYVQGLHERKRDKALITHAMHSDIFETLAHPEATRVGSPQFRFWARKMFQLVEADGGEVKTLVITHGGRPVAVREQIYDILCMAHRESSHAGRDKTCKVLREYYTWIPKELTANFVKACITCMDKRSKEVNRRARLPGKERNDKPSASASATTSMTDRNSVKSESRNFMQSLSYGGPNDAKLSNFSGYSSGDVSAISTPVCSQGSFSGYNGSLLPPTMTSRHLEVDDKSTVTLLGDTTLDPSNSTFMHDSHVSYDLSYTQTPHAQSHLHLSPASPYYPYTPEQELPSQIAHTSTPFPSVNAGAMYNYSTPLHRAPMTPLPPLMDHLSKTASPSLDGQAVLPRIKDGKSSRPHLYTLASSVPIDPMLLPNGNYNNTNSNGLENIHLYAPRPIVNGASSSSSQPAFLSSSGFYNIDYNSNSTGYFGCSVSNTRALPGQALVGPGQAGLGLNTVGRTGGGIGLTRLSE